MAAPRTTIQPSNSRRQGSVRRNFKLPDHRQLGEAKRLRLAALIVVAVLVQIGFAGRVTFFGMRLEFAILVVVLSALLAGSVVGVAIGFCSGLAVDLFSGQPLGGFAIVLACCGYLFGRLSVVRDPRSRTVPIVVGAVGTAIALIGYLLLSLMLQTELRISSGLPFQILGSMLLAAVLSPFVHDWIKSWLDPMLPETAKKNRRRSTRPRVRRTRQRAGNGVLMR